MDTTLATIINIAGKDFLFGVIFGMIIGYFMAKNHIFKEKQEIHAQYNKQIDIILKDKELMQNRFDKEIDRILKDKELAQERFDKELQRTLTDKLAVETKFDKELKRHTDFHDYQLDRLYRNQISDNNTKLFK